MSQQHIFLSHSSHDDVVVDAIRETLDEHHVLGCLDSRHLLPGDSLDPHALTTATTELLAALGTDLEPGGKPVAPEPDQPALSDLILELTQPTMVLQDGKRRPVATARLVRQPTAGEPVVGQPFTFTAPLGPIEAEDLRWYLESYFRWTSDLLREKATEIEAKLPQWGKLLFQAALADPAAADVLAPWRISKPGDKSQRRFTVFVDGNSPPEISNFKS